MKNRFGVRRALILAALAGASIASRSTHAAAHEVDVADAGETDSIYVVGRRLETQDANPAIVIDAEAIARSGATTLDEVLQRLPVFGFQGVNGNQNNGGYGATFADLRNLNFNRTLVLIDGHRVVPSGIQTDEAVDLANVPIALVERIDVMPYGSSPQYGADAIAGVVNILLKHDLSGGSVSASSGAASQGGGETGEMAASYGKALERGNITASATWMRRAPVAQVDRIWARDPIDIADVGSDGRLMLTRGSAASPAGNAVAASGPVGAYTGYDPSAAAFLRAGLTRTTVNVLGHYDTTDSVSLFLDASYSDRVADTRLPPQTLGLSGTAKNPQGFVIGAANPFNPYGAEVTLQRVLAEVGNEDTRSDNRLARVVAGIEGRGFADTRFSFSIDHGSTTTSYSSFNAVNLTRALQTVGDPAACAAVPGCVPADYFGAGSLSPAAASYIRFDAVTRSHYLENVVQGTLERTFEVLPRESWHVTLEAEYRTEHGQTLPDPVVLAGDQAGGDSAVTFGGYNSRELSTSVDLPLLHDVLLAKTLTLNASARYVDTNLFGHFPVWQLGLAWAPFEEVRFRGILGTARRVPAITEAFGGSTTSLLVVTDPCDAANGQLGNATVAANCRSLGLPSTFRQNSSLLAVANGGNANLKPESSRSVDIGAALTPRVAGDLKVSVDYIKFVIHDAIDSLSDADPNFIPDQCFASVALSSPLCKSIVRNPSGPTAGQISRIDAPDQNIGAIDTDDLDIDLAYKIAAGAATLSVDWYNTVLLHYRVQEIPGANFVEEAGTFPSVASAGSLTRYKSLLSTACQAGGWTASWAVRYIGGAHVLGEDSAAAFESAPGVFYHDLSVGLHAGIIAWQLGVDNVADQRPPRLIDGISNTNLNTYDVIGRFFYARVIVDL